METRERKLLTLDSLLMDMLIYNYTLKAKQKLQTHPVLQSVRRFGPPACVSLGVAAIEGVGARPLGWRGSSGWRGGIGWRGAFVQLVAVCRV